MGGRIIHPPEHVNADFDQIELRLRQGEVMFVGDLVDSVRNQDKHNYPIDYLQQRLRKSGLVGGKHKGRDVYFDSDIASEQSIRDAMSRIDANLKESAQRRVRSGAYKQERGWWG